MPPRTPVLRNGRGIGTRRVHIVDENPPTGTESITPTFDRRPERASENICKGVLPGGLRGTVAHHVHLNHRPQSGVDRWLALTDPVVVAGLPGATRAAGVIALLVVSVRAAARPADHGVPRRSRRPRPRPSGDLAGPDLPDRQRRWRLAVVRAPSTLASVAPGYVAEIRTGALVVAREVAESERSAAALDALAAAVRPLIAPERGATR